MMTIYDTMMIQWYDNDTTILQ